jgi:hypothetical protein
MRARRRSRSHPFDRLIAAILKGNYKNLAAVVVKNASLGH